MSKRTILIILVLILAATAWYFTNRKNSVVSSQDFIIEDTSIVDKIILGKDNQILKLEKVDGEWMVNDTFQVNMALLRLFLRVFGNLNLVAPVSNNFRDSIIESLKETGIKISVFSDKELQKEYLLGNLNISKSGNYLYLPEKNIGIVNTSGLVKDLKDIISVNSLFWRNRLIFKKKTNQIVRLTHKNLKNIEKSYTIYVKNGEFSLLNHADKQIKSFDKTAVNRYLSYFQNIGFERIETSLTSVQKDSVLKLNLAHTIILVDDSNILYELNLYLKPAKISDKEISKEFDLNEIYGIMNNEKNTLVFDYYIIDLVLKDIDYFLFL